MKLKNLKRFFIFSYRKYILYPTSILILRLFFSKNDKSYVYIFHHIPKTAGTTFNSYLKKNFFLFKDYRLGWTNKINKPFDITNFNNKCFISGHFDYYPNCSAKERYNRQLKTHNKKFKTIAIEVAK